MAKKTCIDYIDSRRAVISGERNVHKELVTMPLEGFWCENIGVKIMTVCLSMTLAVDP